MSRVYNFSAGPAALPLEVLQRIQEDIPDWQGTGMSVMEVSHRGKEFVELAARSEATLRDLLAVPDDYSVLFPQGGATMQFGMVPMNLLAGSSIGAYVDQRLPIKIKTLQERQARFLGFVLIAPPTPVTRRS